MDGCDKQDHVESDSRPDGRRQQHPYRVMGKAEPGDVDMLFREQRQERIEKTDLWVIYEIPEHADYDDGNNIRYEENRAKKAGGFESETRERYCEKGGQRHNSDDLARYQKIVVADRSPDNRIVEHFLEIIEADKRFIIRHAGPIKERIVQPLYNGVNRKYAEE